jgi:type VI secretion system protein ImpH
MPKLRNRLRVVERRPEKPWAPGEVLAYFEDLSLLYYSGMFAHHPRCAVALQAILQDYFRLDAQVLQFQGQWLYINPSNQTRLEDEGGNNQLGATAFAGEQIWDLQSKIRVRLGPLGYARFEEFLPDTACVRSHGAFFTLAHLVRLYVGPELDFDIQVVLRAEDVPECDLSEEADVEPALGWNTWLSSLPFDDDAEDAVFPGEEVFVVGRQSDS